MKRLCALLPKIAWIAIIAGQTACKKPAETVKTDLEEAGYQLTPEDWFRASRENDPAALKKFLAAGYKVDLTNPDGDSALHIAASAGAEKSAHLLMDRGAKLDQMGGAGRTPLMAAVIADQTLMVRWLLRNGADPQPKDADGFFPLMLAVREGRGGAVAELAPYMRERLDDALLFAALVGRADVIDALTNYGASPYARMEDGRTPLMIAAENGHQEAVTLLLDVGASRYATTADGLTAADLAVAAGHQEISALILRAPRPEEFALEAPSHVAEIMDEQVERAAAKDDGIPLATLEKVALTDDSIPESSPRPSARRSVSPTLEGEVLSHPVPSATAKSDAFPLPPLVMRHYRERDVPIRLKSVQGETATLDVLGAAQPTIQVHPGETIPGSNLTVVRVQRRMEHSKVNQGGETEISVMDVRDLQTGESREWISGVTSSAHDPVALVEDAATGKRYLAASGQRFKAADGTTFIVTDVRPNQLVIENAATGAVQTIPLRGPRG